MPHHKSNLPQKRCVVCQRPFEWRKKWERDWDSVKYCSERCRRDKATAAPIVVLPEATPEERPGCHHSESRSLDRAASLREGHR